jgi:hypothetical protein
MPEPAALLGLPLGEAQALVTAAGEVLLPPVRTQPSARRMTLSSAPPEAQRVLRADFTPKGVCLVVASPVGWEQLAERPPC